MWNYLSSSTSIPSANFSVPVVHSGLRQPESYHYLNFTRYGETSAEHNEDSFVDIFSVSYNNSYKNSSNFDDTGSNLKQLKRNYLITFVFVALLSVVINLRVLHVVTLGADRKVRPVSILVAHMSSAAICFTFVLFFYILEKSYVISLTAPGICELLSFLRNGIYSVFPLNAVGIIYERIRTFQITLGRLLVLRTISLIWVVAIFGSLPSIFTAEYEKDPITNVEKCKQINLFGSFEATLVYETFRFFLYHFLVCTYMAFALFKIRSKIRYLYIRKIPNERLRRKVQRVRFVYLHSIIFILIWLPTGLVLCVYKILCRKLPPTLSDSVKNYLFPLTILNFTLFIFSPLVYVFLHEDMSKINFIGLSCRSHAVKIKDNDDNEDKGNKIQDERTDTLETDPGNKRKTPAMSQQNSQNVILRKDKSTNRRKLIKINGHMEITDMTSRVSTVAHTATSDASSLSSLQLTLRPVPEIILHPSSIPVAGNSHEAIRVPIERQRQADTRTSYKLRETFV